MVLTDSVHSGGRAPALAYLMLLCCGAAVSLLSPPSPAPPAAAQLMLGSGAAAGERHRHACSHYHVFSIIIATPARRFEQGSWQAPEHACAAALLNARAAGCAAVLPDLSVPRVPRFRAHSGWLSLVRAVWLSSLCRGVCRGRSSTLAAPPPCWCRHVKSLPPVRMQARERVTAWPWAGQGGLKSERL